MPIYLAGVGDAPPIVVPDQFVGFDAMTWTDWTGTTFDLLGFEDDVLVMRDGLRGLNMPAHDRYTNESPVVAGSSFRGFRTKERPVFWPTMVRSTVSADDFLAADRALWQGLHPDTVGQWAITVRGVTRTLTLRYTGDGDQVTNGDPIGRGWELYGLNFVAEQPYWSGAPVVALFSNVTTSATFFDSSRTLGSSFTLSSATVSNLGDVEAYPVWTILGPCTTTAITIGGQVIGVPITLTSGQRVTIDTNPGALTAIREDGTDVTGSLGSRGFAPIQPGTTVPLGLAMTGNGSIAVALTPLFYRAY